MFDPTQYFGTIARKLSGCDSWADTTGPKLAISFDRFKHWEIITWRFEVRFRSGHRFTAFESHSWRDKKHLRKIAYRLMQASGELIFQVDSHETQCPFEKPPHLHIGPTEDETFEDGDSRLGDTSLRNFDFLRIWAWVLAYIQENGRVPWLQ